MIASVVCFSLRQSGQGSTPHVLLGNPDEVAPDSDARSVSSGRGVPTPCTRRRPPCDLWHRTFYPDVRHPEFCSVNIPSGYLTSENILCRHSIRIFHIRRLTPDGRGGRFNFPGQTYPDPLIALTWRVSQPFFAQCCGVLLKLPDMCDRHFQIFFFRYLMSTTDILGYFALDIWCLNPQTLLVTHQLQDSLVIKFGKRVNNPLYIVCNLIQKNGESGELVLRDASFVQFCKEVKYRALLCFYLLILIVFSYQPNKL